MFYDKKMVLLNNNIYLCYFDTIACVCVFFLI